MVDDSREECCKSTDRQSNMKKGQSNMNERTIKNSTIISTKRWLNDQQTGNG
jgi:hypothetical protein